MTMQPQTIIPQAPCEGLSLREWLTGCVLTNSSLMKNGTPSELGKKAVAIADEAMLALQQPPEVHISDFYKNLHIQEKTWSKPQHEDADAQRPTIPDLFVLKSGNR